MMLPPLTGETLASLATLSVLEIVLGIDNIIFLSLISSRLPKAQQRLARQAGLGLALAGRIGFLFCITWLMKADEALIMVGEFAVTWRGIILMLGGLFLIYKSVAEIHTTVEGIEGSKQSVKKLALSSALLQIAALDIVFALDSMITAVGLSDHLAIMIAANVIAMGVMLAASEPVSAFIEKHPSLKILALSFLLMIGVALVADATNFHIPRGYIYFSLAFSSVTEFLNIYIHRKKARPARRKSS